MAKYCFWITTSPGSVPCLYTRNTCEGQAGCLACLLTFRSISTTRYEAWTTSLRRSSAPIVCVKSTSQTSRIGLKNLYLWSKDETVPVPDSFLGGSASRLKYLILHRIPFPGLPKLLLSATHLVTLSLNFIPHSGYFPPDAIAAVLPTLTRLTSFYLQFISTRSCPDRETRRPPLGPPPSIFLSSPFSRIFGSRGSANIWRILSPASMPPNSNICK
jgi:hypothetical protein